MKIFNRRVSIAIHDLSMVALAWSLAYLFRFNFNLSTGSWSAFLTVLPLVVIVQGTIFWGTGLYRGLWRFASIPDLWNIIRAALWGALAASLVLFLFNRLEGVPRTTLALYPIFLVSLLGAPRLLYRMWKDHGLSPGTFSVGKRVLVLGAGRAGEMLARDMLRERGYQPVAFLDDNSKLGGAKIHGVPVLGVTGSLSEAIKNLDIDIVMIAMPSATSAQMQRVVELCEKTGLPFRTLPRLEDLMEGRSVLQELRDVAIEDLLGRDPVSLDWKSISNNLLSFIIRKLWLTQASCMFNKTSYKTNVELMTF